MSIFINYLIIIMNFIIEELNKRKQQQQRGKNFGMARNQGSYAPPFQNNRPPHQNQNFVNPSMGTPTQNYRPPRQQPQIQQNQPAHNPSPQYPQQSPQPTQRYSPQFPRNQTPQSQTTPNNSNQHNFRANMQQFPRQDGQMNTNRNVQQNQNVNFNPRSPNNGNGMGNNMGINPGYNQNYPRNNNNFPNRYNQNTMQNPNQDQQGYNPRNQNSNPSPMGESYSNSPKQRNQQSPRHNQGQNQFPRPEQPPPYQNRPKYQHNQYQAQGGPSQHNQGQQRFQRSPSPQRNNRQYQQQQGQNQYKPDQAPRQQWPNQRYQNQGQNSGHQQNFPAQRGNYRGRGDRNRGRGRGRGGFRGNSQDQIVDNRVLTNEQAEQRAKKFIKHNQPIKPRPSSQKPPNPPPKPQPKKKQQSDSEHEESQSKMQQDIEDSKEEIREADSQEEYEDESQYEDSNEKSYHSSIEQGSGEGQQEQSEEEQYSIEKESQPAQIKVIPKKQRNQTGEGSKQSIKMCSQKQFGNRMKIFMQNNNDKIESDGPNLKVVNNNLNLDTSKSFSIFELNKKTYLPDPQLALKKFQRSANRADDEDDVTENQAVYIPRNKEGLTTTMQHIKKEILDADTKSADQLIFPVPPGQKRLEFIQIYVFLWDRMREMIKDITRLNQESKHDSSVIQMCEQITRFFILSINQGRKRYKNELDFDDKMNKESLVKIMTPLLGIYADSKLRLNQLIKQMEEQAQKSEDHQEITIEQVMSRMEEQGIYISPNQPQITSYAILFSVDYRKYLYENIFVGLELKDFNPLYQSKQIQQVLSIKSALSLKNYSKYFDMIESEDFQYLLSCLMVLNIQQIRKEMSNNLLVTFKYVQGGVVKKGVNSNYLKNSLRFQNQQENQFRKFLNTIQSRIQNDYVIWDDQIPESQEIYKPPAYALDFKLKRKYFLQADDKKDRNMKRSDIVSRSWKQSTYVEELISCFLHRDYNPIIKFSPRLKNQPEKKPQKLSENKKQPEVASLSSPSVNEANEVQPVEKQSKNVVLAARVASMKAKHQRRKFLQALTLKLTEVLRPDPSKQQIKQKAAKDIFNILIKQHQYLLASSLQAFQNYAFEQMQKQLVLIRMHQFYDLKRAYLDGFKSLPQGQDKKFSPFTMTNLLQRCKSEQTDYMYGKKDELHFLKTLRVEKIRQFNIKFFVDLDEEQKHYPLIERILRNLLVFLFGRVDVPAFDIQKKNYVVAYPDLTINLSIESLAKCQLAVTHLLGIDSVIYLQTKASIQNFSKMLSEYFSLQNSVNKQQKLSLPIGVIRLLDSSDIIKFDQLSFPPLLECLDFIKTTSMEIGASMNLGLIGFMNVSMKKYRARPKIQVKSINHIFGLMASNLHLVKKTLTPELTTQSIFLYYQQYFNLSIEKVINLCKKFYESPTIFSNWLNILKDIYNEPVKPHKIQDTMVRQYSELNSLLFSLKLNSPYETNQDKSIFGKNDFIEHYELYIKKFDREKVITKEQIVKMVQLLKLGNNNQILGNIGQFYQELLKILGELLVSFNIACPQNLKIHLAREELYRQTNLIFEKLQEKAKKLEQRIRNILPQNNRAFVPGASLINFQNPSPQPQSDDHIMQNQNLSKSSSKVKSNSNQPPNTLENRTIPNLSLNINSNSQRSSGRQRPKSQFKYSRASWIQEAKKKLKME